MDSIRASLRKTLVSELNGLGHIMPFTFTAYTIAAVSIIGLPPLAGSWSKWFLIDGALNAERLIIAAAFLISTLLNIVYLLPIALNGFLLTPAARMSGRQAGRTRVGVGGIEHALLPRHCARSRAIQFYCSSPPP